MIENPIRAWGMYEASKGSSLLGASFPMLRVYAAACPSLIRRLAPISAHMSKRSKDPACTSPEPAAKRQRVITSIAGRPEAVTVEATPFQLKQCFQNCAARHSQYEGSQDRDVLQMAQAAHRSVIPHEEFAALRQSMEHSDSQRETIIKKSRGMFTL